MNNVSSSKLRIQLNGCIDPYKFLFDKGNDGVFIYVHGNDGISGNFIDVNQKAYEMLGYTKEEILELSPEKFIAIGEKGMVSNHITGESKQKGRYVFETILLKKDGSKLEVEISGHHFNFRGQDITLLITRDQTERKEQERKIVKASQKWRKTFDSITDFVSVHDKDFKLVRVNKALSEFLQIKPQELLGRYCFEVLHGLKKPWSNCPHKKAIHHEKTVTEMVDDAAIGVPLLVCCSPCFDDNNEMVGTVHIARDISKEQAESREKEKLIKELNTALAEVKKLSGLLPICASCKRIRNDRGSWIQIETYIKNHAEVEFTHGMCPECMHKLYPDYVDRE